MKNKNNILVLMAVAVLVAACSGNFREKVGLRKQMPDEFRVVSHAPLTIPPDFTLRPPTPGAPRPQSSGLDKQAEKTVFGRELEGGKISQGQKTLINRLNVEEANPAIREVLKEDERQLEAQRSQKGGILSKIPGFRRGGFDPVVNATKERERLSKNQKEGKPANEGEVPVVE